MASYISPLVDIQEYDATTTIPAVSTSVGVIILRDTYKGPELKKQFISSINDLITVFGKPTNKVECYRDILSAAGYLKYGNMLYCTRSLNTSATFAGLEITETNSVVTSASYSPRTLVDMSDNIVDAGGSGDVDDFEYIDPLGFMSITALSRGVWGNRIRIAIAGKDAYIDQSQWVIDERTLFPDSSITWSTSAAIGRSDNSIEDDHSFLVLVQTIDQSLPGIDQTELTEPISGGTSNWVTREIFNVSLDPNAYDDTGRKRFVETMINESSNYIRVSLNQSTYTPIYDVSDFFTSEWLYLTMGTGGDTDFETADETSIIDALDLYENPEEIDVNIFIESIKSDEIKKHIVDICEARMDSMAILDPPMSTVVGHRTEEVGLLVSYVNTLSINSSYACIYGNWIEVYDKWNGKYRWCPPSGLVAGLFANNDNISESWFAPAGPNRAIITNARRLGWNANFGDRNIIYKNRINPIISLSGMGKLIYGQKTLLDKDSDFNRINIRRLFMVLEKAIATASRYFLFEPNDDISRLLLVNMIDPFLRDVKARRGIYDYLVICNETNNTPERIDRGELWCDIYIKPVRAAEFIVLNFIATKTGTSFSEVGGFTTG